MLTEPPLEILHTAEDASERAAELLAKRLSDAIAVRGAATLALSGGDSPARMIEILGQYPLPWDVIDVFQVDERVAPDGHADRNARQIKTGFAAQMAARPDKFHLMPVTVPELGAAAHIYEELLRAKAGSPPILDAIHLGIGADGHTASIFPDSVIDESRDVTVTGVHQGRRRMTLTLPLINRSRSLVWLVLGTAKARALARLVAAEPGLVASRVRRSAVVIVADAEAASVHRAERDRA